MRMRRFDKMKSFRSGVLLGTLVGLALVPPATNAVEDAPGFQRIALEDTPWKPLPGYEGVRVAVMAGDPSKPGLYVVRVNFPPGLMSRPHFHPDDPSAVGCQGN